MTRKQKGNKNENKACDILESMGYNCIRPNPKHRMQKDTGRVGYNDFFGLWDVIAVKEDDLLFVQVKSNRNDTYGKRLDPHRAFIAPPCVRKQCWLMMDKQDKPHIIEL